jgi:hypothetical protein
MFVTYHAKTSNPEKMKADASAKEQVLTWWAQSKNGHESAKAGMIYY